MLPPSRRPVSPLSHGLLVRQPLWNLWLRARNQVLEWTARDAPLADGDVRSRELRRVLIGVGGHLGDAVIASGIPRLLQSQIPGLEIGIVAGSWNAVVFASHPRVWRFHAVDHWMTNRSASSLSRRVRDAFRSRALALHDIREARYDAAIDLAAYFPNHSALFREAGIPVRVGYPTGGDGALLTHRAQWTAGRHASQDHVELLRVLLPRLAPHAVLEPELPELGEAEAARATQALRAHSVTAGQYVVIHPGAGAARKEWGADRWSDVARRLLSAGHGVVVTGAGAAQGAVARRIVRDAPGVANLCDALAWDEFRGVIASARLVLSVDTAAAHLAGAAGVPCITLMTGIDATERWSALGTKVQVLTNPVPCSPCYLSKGCATMNCIRGLSVETVTGAAMAMLSA